MSDIYASSHVHDSYTNPITTPLTNASSKSLMSEVYGTTDEQTETISLYYVDKDDWGKAEDLPAGDNKPKSLYRRTTDKYFTINSSSISRWLSLDELLDALLSPSNKVSDKILYSNADGSVIKMFQYTDPHDGVLKYLINPEDLSRLGLSQSIYFKWITESFIRSNLSSKVSFDNEKAQPLHFINKGNSAASVTLKASGSVTTNYQTSTDGSNWSPYTLGTTISLTNKDDKVYFRGNRSTQDANNFIQFELSSDSSIECYGNVNSLLSTSFSTITDLNNYGSYTFKDLFSDCTSLKKSPMIPATKLKDFCYTGIFRNCTSLESAPAMPAYTLASGCYWAMFAGCTSLTVPPNLSAATTLKTNCYNRMFYSCTSLEESPKLVSKNLVARCYEKMFCNCSSLKSVYCYAEIIPAGATTDWLSKDLSTAAAPADNAGKLYSSSLDLWEIGDSGVPTKWINYLAKPLCLECKSDSSVTVVLGQVGSLSSASYQYNTGDYLSDAYWRDYSLGEEITLTKGDKVYFRGSCSGRSTTSYPKFYMTGESPIIDASGNIDSLLSSSDYIEMTSSNISYAFYCLFEDCTALRTPPELPLQIITQICYYKLFAGCTSLKQAPKLHSRTSTSGFSYMFYNCSSLTMPPVLPTTIYSVGHQFCYSHMFDGSGITTAPELSSGSLPSYSCQYMFANCKQLKSPPAIPQSSINSYSCQYMFSGSGITSIPSLDHITSVGSSGFNCMFQNCSGLTDLSDSTVNIFNTANSCYGMFRSCANLTTPPKLSGATELSESSVCQYMFLGCIKLEYVPDMHFTSVSTRCLNGMFQGCSSIVRLDNLLSQCVSLGESSAELMFYGCTSLETISNLLPMCHTVGDSACKSMFQNCVSLKEVLSGLTAENLGTDCYKAMFQNCRLLAYTPELYATDLSNGCYAAMFYGCSNLKHVYLGADTSATASNLSTWLYGCASVGEIVVQNSSVRDSLVKNSTSGIPTGWSIINLRDWSTRPCDIHFDDESTGNVNILLQKQGSLTSSYWYSHDLLRWHPLEFSQTLVVNSDYPDLYIRGNRSQQSSTDYIQFKTVGTGKFRLWGNILSLVYSYDNASCFHSNTDGYLLTSLESAGSYTFYKLFEKCKHIFHYDSEVLSHITSLTPHCYDHMFSESSIVEGTALYAQTIPAYAYYYMFYSCTNLTECPDISLAKNIDYYAMAYMFCGCNAITSCPSFSPDKIINTVYTNTSGARYNNSGCSSMFLNCKSLVNTSNVTLKSLSDTSYNSTYTYSSMFEGCTSLTVPPILSSTTLVSFCYQTMFRGCTSLTNPPSLPATTLAPYCYDGMFRGCTSLTNPPSLPATVLTGGYCYRNMFTGCTNLTSSPTLPATNLTAGCYSGMFSGCTSLNKVTCHATSTASSSTTNWLNEVADEGKFYSDNDSGTFWSHDANGIPVKWRHCVNDKEYLYFHQYLKDASSDGTTVSISPVSLYGAIGDSRPAYTSVDYFHLFKAEGASNFETIATVPEYSASRLRIGITETTVGLKLYYPTIYLYHPVLTEDPPKIKEVDYRVNVKDLGNFIPFSTFSSMTDYEKSEYTKFMSKVQWASSFTSSGVNSTRTNLWNPRYFPNNESFVVDSSNTPVSIPSSLFSRVWLYNMDNSNDVDSSNEHYPNFKISCLIYNGKPEIYFNGNKYDTNDRDYILQNGAEIDRVDILACFLVKQNKWYDLPDSNNRWYEYDFILWTVLNSVEGSYIKAIK